MSDARKKFYSREKANAGKKLFLKTPEGVETEEFLIVVNTDSEVMAKAHSEARTAAVENRQLAKPDPDFAEKAKRKLVASAVIGWSFEEKATPEAVQEFLRECPHIQDDVDTLIYDRKAFFGGAA